jgi:hypothetical protein
VKRKAVKAGVLRDAQGRIVSMESGPCLWCDEWVEEDRDGAGATRPFDPCWQHDGDFGCDMSPETCKKGVGSHARPYDLILAMQGIGYDGKSIGKRERY